MRNIQICVDGSGLGPVGSFVSVDDQAACSAIALGYAVPYIGEMPAQLAEDVVVAAEEAQAAQVEPAAEQPAP